MREESSQEKQQFGSFFRENMRRKKAKDGVEDGEQMSSR